MKKFFLLILLCLKIQPCFSYSTEASKFAELQYAKQNCISKVHINVKKEHTAKTPQNTIDSKTAGITFGYGDLKSNVKICGKRKLRISYICLLDKNFKPVWSHITQTK